MKIVSEKKVAQFLKENLTTETILNVYQPTLVQSLLNYSRCPESIPPRTVQNSATIEGSTHFFMPCIAPNEVGIKLITGGAANNSKGLGFQGAVVVEDEETGEIQGLVNAKTLTAFRTALATSIAMARAIDPYGDAPVSMAVFGVGLQAYWHLKLALVLYKSVACVVVVNRTLEKAQQFKTELQHEYPHLDVSAHLFDVDPAVISQCTIVFGCTPSTEAIITPEHINMDPAQKTFIGLIGSYKPHMVELDLGFIAEHYVNSTQDPKPRIIVDSKHHALDEAGELIQSGMGADQLVELSQLRAMSNAEITTAAGNVTVLKVVGLSIMDVSMAKLLLREITDAVEVAEF